MRFCSLQVRGTKLHLAAYLVIILVAINLLNFKLRPNAREDTANNASNMQTRLRRVLHEIQQLKKQNINIIDTLITLVSWRNPEDIIERIQIIKRIVNKINETQTSLETQFTLAHDVPDAPSLLYEQTRRRLESGVIEMGFFFGAQLKELRSLMLKDPEISATIQRLIVEGIQHKRTLLNLSDRLAIEDNYYTWREQEAENLSKLVQQHLYHSQHPQNCSEVRLLVCEVNKRCGFACQMNHVFNCLVEAVGSQRTMVLRNKTWTAYQPPVWSDVFLPISNCSFTGHAAKWPSVGAQVVQMTKFENSLDPKPRYLPLGIPREFALRLKRLHGEPAAWWVGQFMKYLFQPQATLTRVIVEATHKLKFKKPIVGIHIRRSDKLIREAMFHSLVEYMKVVDEYYEQLELLQKVEQRRVYIATDDSNVFQRAKKMYPTYEIIGDPEVSAAVTKKRFGKDSIYGIIKDIYFLAHSDFIVCTFSSGVCRLAYELMQSLHFDGSMKARSLDDIYFSSGQVKTRLREVVYNHHAIRPEEIELKIGDIIEVAGNHWDGYSLGTNNRTGIEGLYPSYKVVDKIELKDFPPIINHIP